MAGADSLLADRRLVIAVLGVVVVLPLCFPRDLGALAWVSAAAVRPVAVGQMLAVCGGHVLARAFACWSYTCLSSDMFDTEFLPS